MTSSNRLRRTSALDRDPHSDVCIPACGIALLLPFQVSGAWIARSDWWNTVAPGLIGPP